MAGILFGANGVVQPLLVQKDAGLRGILPQDLGNGDRVVDVRVGEPLDFETMFAADQHVDHGCQQQGVDRHNQNGDFGEFTQSAHLSQRHGNEQADEDHDQPPIVVGDGLLLLSVVVGLEFDHHVRIHDLLIHLEDNESQDNHQFNEAPEFGAEQEICH